MNYVNELTTGGTGVGAGAGSTVVSCVVPPQ